MSPAAGTETALEVLEVIGRGREPGVGDAVVEIHDEAITQGHEQRVMVKLADLLMTCRRQMSHLLFQPGFLWRGFESVPERDRRLGHSMYKKLVHLAGLSYDLAGWLDKMLHDMKHPSDDAEEDDAYG